jgi:hypothetical protein
MQAYTQYGTVFWPDYCNMHANNPVAWDLFDLPPAKKWPVDASKTTAWMDKCLAHLVPEIESGQIILNKKKAWRGLYLTAFVSANSHYFLQKVFKGDKQTFAFAFNATGTPYYKLKRVPEALGILSKVNGKRYFCGNTMVHRHPKSGEMLFLHRNGAKFHSKYNIFDKLPIAWKHQAAQKPGDAWGLMFNGELPPEYFIGEPTDSMQMSCIHVESPHAIIKPVDSKVTCSFFLRF